MANRDHILLSYQLPALQAALHYWVRLSERVVRAIHGRDWRCCRMGLYFLRPISWIHGELLTALLFASNPSFLRCRRPLSGNIDAGRAILAFHFVFSGQVAAASLSLGVACFSRVMKRGLPAQYSYLHLQWTKMAPNGGLSSCDAVRMGAAVVDVLIAGAFRPGWHVRDGNRHFLWRFMRYVYLGWDHVKNTPLPVLAWL